MTTALAKRAEPALSVERAAELLARAKRIEEVKQIRDLGVAARAYARERAAGKEAVADAAEIVLRAERRIGEFVAKLPKAKGTAGTLRGRDSSGGAKLAPLEKQPALHETLGMRKDPAKKLASRAQRLAAMPVSEFRDKVRETRERVLGEPRPHVTQATGENEWYTPARIVELARRTMGGIDLDPASIEEANGVVKAARFYSIADNGLKKEWRGRIWLNPPYEARLIGQFAEKLVGEIDARRVVEACVLVNNATETDWFQSLAARCQALCLPRGRIRFLTPGGREMNTPLQGQAILYFGRPSAASFATQFSKLGAIFRSA